VMLLVVVNEVREEGCAVMRDSLSSKDSAWTS